MRHSRYIYSSWISTNLYRPAHHLRHSYYHSTNNGNSQNHVCCSRWLLLRELDQMRLLVKLQTFFDSALQCLPTKSIWMLHHQCCLLKSTRQLQCCRQGRNDTLRTEHVKSMTMTHGVEICCRSSMYITPRPKSLTTSSSPL